MEAAIIRCHGYDYRYVIMMNLSVSVV